MQVTRRGTDWIIGEVNAQQVRINNVRVITVRQPAIATPVGGAMVDSESRDAISSILGVLRTHGLIAP